MKHPARILAAVVVAGALSGACGTDSRPTTARGAAAPEAGAATAVTIKLFRFDPDPVRVEPGTTVRWTNEDQILHTVTAGTRAYDEQGLAEAVAPTGQFDLPLDGAGSTAEFTFTEPGTVAYVCKIHPGMDAEIVVS